MTGCKVSVGSVAYDVTYLFFIDIPYPNMFEFEFAILDELIGLESP